MIPKNSIATTLQKYRQSKNLSKEDLAQLLHLSLEDYKFIEDGNRPVPFKTMQIIFDKLDVSELEFSNGK